MGFKAQVAADASTFLNVEEFGDLRSLDGGGPVPCVLDDQVRSEHSAEGVFLSESTLHVRASALGAVPVITQRMTVDGRPANVQHVAENMGMLAIRLRWCES